MLVAPAARLQQGKQAAITTGSTGATRPSLRNDGTAYTWSPRSTGLVSLRRFAGHRQRNL